MYKVKEVAELADVSVRTLHHYDHIGLLSPVRSRENGYRVYRAEELPRLQQILFFRELDFSLDKIKRILDDPEFDQEQALHRHRDILIKKRNRLDRIINSVEQTIQSLEGGRKMSNKDRFEPFDKSEIEAHQKKYEKEVEERWGDTDAYKESQRKTASYTKEDWKRIQKEGNEIDRRIIDRMDQGPEDAEVQRLIGEKRQHISDNFYHCTPEIFRGLADMYVNDPRFTKNIDMLKEGYAAFLQKAMHVYCDRLEQ
ncbi:MerR family transcriptional regulator [Halobacillus sp. BBL2006]|uniref:MerR family transcriptional regulator n=1 Tax=Halobacillus sp. BBL2006 TaxID=1543706 RepID=UPI000543B6D3|nr:MerR family transcriptional regulator [Halobacillus sp. BBL2006]KHE70422.1 MerR family transcriptional regulator [Halobacillus sp. BBL2006]